MAKAKTHAARSKAAASQKSGGDNRAAGPVDSQIGALIRARRLQLGVSQVQLAGKLGLTFQQVQKYEKGVNRVAASTLMRIARALECDMTDLLPDQSV